MINPKNMNWVHRKKDEECQTKENSPVETIAERLKRLHTNEIDGRKRLRLREEKGGRAGGKENN